MQPVLHPLRGRCLQRVEVGIDRQVVAHGVALDHAAHARHIHRLAVGLPVDDAEADLSAACRGEVGLHGDARREAEAVRIRHVDERAPGIERRGLEHDPVLAGAHGPGVGVEHHLEVVGLGGGELVREIDLVCVGHRLVVLAPDHQLQRGRRCAAQRAALLDVERQDQHVAPALDIAQRAVEGGERVLDDRVHLALQLARALRRLQEDRTLERIARELPGERGMALAQRLGGRRGCRGGQHRADEQGAGQPPCPGDDGFQALHPKHRHVPLLRAGTVRPCGSFRASIPTSGPGPVSNGRRDRADPMPRV